MAVLLTRRRALALAALALPGLQVPLAHAQSADWLAGGILRDARGSAVTVFGLDAATAAEVLLPATQADALPDGYAPADLVSTSANGIPAAGRQLIRQLIVDDTRALLDEAQRNGLNLYVGSGFRSQAYQADVFTAQTARWGDADTANRYSARPGHSQHQLGTTIDFTDNFRAFRTSDAAAWLSDNAHRFGFVLPYTPASVSRTGYVDEPWHARWVGADLAARLQTLGYQSRSDLTADDAVALVQAAIG